MLSIAIWAGGLPGWGADAAPAGDGRTALLRNFEAPSDDARIMMRWWWYGPAVTKAGLEREMRSMKQGGIGGFEVQPTYALVLDDPGKGIRNLPYLSQEFLEMLRFTGAKAKELGLRMDLTLGSGWPYGGPMVPATQAAGRLRIDKVKVAAGTRRVPMPDLANGEQFIAAFAGGTTEELKDIRDGILWLREAAASRGGEVWFFVSSRTGQMVKRPAVNADGFVVDHYDRAALDAYLKSLGEPQLKALATQVPYAIFCDSLEVFASDWTPTFLAEFQKRRGYDLKPLLPHLAADLGPESAAIRRDWGLTLTELLEDNFLTPLEAYAKAHGTKLRIQNYGMPPATIASSRMVDLPEGEGPQWKTVRAARWGSSASHLFGRNVTSSETWTWLHSPSFRATPLDMKAEADLHFLQGINQLIGHGWPYNPEGVEYPGTRFYAAAVFNDRNPWWNVMPDVARYLQRVSHLLRQGKPANDVALYMPNDDAWASFGPGRVHMIDTLSQKVGPELMGRIFEAGYNLDFFDDAALEKAGKVEKGALVWDGNRYRIVVLPGVESMPVATLKKLEEFVRGGGILIATRRVPAKAPGRSATAAEQAEMKALSARLFEGGQARLVSDEKQLGAALRRLTPDMAFEPASQEIGFVHRHTEAGEIYFVANTSNQPLRGRAAFRVEGLDPEWWDPMTGKASAAKAAARGAGTLNLDLDIEPYGSRIVFFGHGGAPAAQPEGRVLRTVDLATGWQVSFPTSVGQVSMDAGKSWTGDERTRYFSGVATYSRQVEVPAEAKGVRVVLDFGEAKAATGAPARSGMRAWLDAPVREAAVVKVNGKRAGSLWCPPYRIDISPFIRSGMNRLEIEVANVALNHMAGRRLPDYRLLNLRYGVRFEPQDMDKVQPIPSGLLGPIQLRIVTRED